MMTRRALLATAPFAAAQPSMAQDRTAPLEAYERQSGGRIGVYAEHVTTKSTFAWRAQERFVMCSTFKASLAACILARVDRGADSLEAVVAYGQADLLEYAPTARQNVARGGLTVREMCEAAVELSDNTCANLLLDRIGGPSQLTAFWRSIGDEVSRLDHTEPLLNRSPPGDPHDTTTPAAMAAALKRLVLGEVLSVGSRSLLADWLVGCKTGDNRLREGLPKAWRIGDKTGNNGKDASGDIAMAWSSPASPIVICVYTQGGTPTPALLESTFAAIGRTVASAA